MDIKQLLSIFEKSSYHTPHNEVVFTVKDEMISACTTALANDRVVNISAPFMDVQDIVFGVNTNEALTELKKFKGEVSISFEGSSMFVKSVEGRKKSVEIPIFMDVSNISCASPINPVIDQNRLTMNGDTVLMPGRFAPDLKIMKSVFKDAMDAIKGGTLSITDGLVEWSVVKKLKGRDEIVADDIEGNDMHSMYTGLADVVKILDGETRVYFGSGHPVIFDEWSGDIHTTYVIMPRMEN